MISLPRFSRDVRYEKLITLIILIVLFFYLFFPELVTVDRFTLTLLAMLILISIMPTVNSAKLPYLLEVKRELKKMDGDATQLDKKTNINLIKTLKELKEVQEKALSDSYTTKKEMEEIYDATSSVLSILEKGVKK